MKRVSGFILAAVFAVFFSGQLFAQSEGSAVKSDAKQTTTVTAGKFVDNNNNGVCDNHEARVKDGKCANFVDADGDGVCDNRANCTGQCKGNQNCCKGQATCPGKGMKAGNRNGCGGPCGARQVPDKK